MPLSYGELPDGALAHLHPPPSDGWPCGFEEEEERQESITMRGEEGVSLRSYRFGPSGKENEILLPHLGVLSEGEGLFLLKFKRGTGASVNETV